MDGDFPNDDEPIITIAPVTRKGMKLLISLFGLSETGKTYSALQLASGIEPDPAKRGFLDTEGGERGRAYGEDVPGGFLYAALKGPFTPERYMKALEAFVKAGVTTLVVDSVSHAWFAAGGVLDMVEQSTERNDMAKWAKPKRRLGKLTGQWLHCGLHLILCARGKQPLVEEIGDNGKKKLVPGAIVPIQEKQLRFDMSVMGLMLGDGEFTVERKWGGKCPGMWRPIFAAGTKMNEEMGRRLIDWIGGHDALTAEQRMLAMTSTEKAGGGVDSFRAWWAALPAMDRDFLRPSLANLQSIAKEHDDEIERLAAAERERDAQDKLDDPFGGNRAPTLIGGAKAPTVQEKVAAEREADPFAGSDADPEPAAPGQSDALWVIEQIENAQNANALTTLLSTPAVKSKLTKLSKAMRDTVDTAEKAVRMGFDRKAGGK